MTDTNLLVKNPLQYLDREVNARRRDFDSAAVRAALAFPDLYELGMSHLGLKILYEILNGEEDFLAERVFAPARDREDQLRRSGTPLASLESARPLGDFDILGFTLPYELTYTNILNMLDLAGIPLGSSERDGRHPLVAGGGPGRPGDREARADARPVRAAKLARRGGADLELRGCCRGKAAGPVAGRGDRAGQGNGQVGGSEEG